MRPKKTIPRRFLGTTCCSFSFQDAPGLAFDDGSLSKGWSRDEDMVGIEDGGKRTCGGKGLIVRTGRVDE
jgi:hypothetical protein